MIPKDTAAAWAPAAKAAWQTAQAVDKCRQVNDLWARFAGKPAFLASPFTPPIAAGESPGRPLRPRLVPPADVPRRRLGAAAGRAALIHAIAHIEFNAINLALDAALRFTGMPGRYYYDWLLVAADEARHFALLENRLASLGYSYGDFPAHGGLWEMAEKTAGDVLLRMALTPRVLEARGLDVTPGMIARFDNAGDTATSKVLAVILEEEVQHVAIGSRWFTWICAERALGDPSAVFCHLVKQHYRGHIAGPLNLAARRAAGFSEAELAWLGG